MSNTEKERIDNEKQPKKADYNRDVSMDELDAVVGGYDREMSDGCAATVERDSWCWSDDYCHMAETTYKPVGSPVY